MNENEESEPEPGDVEVTVAGEVVADSAGDPIEGATVSAFRVDGDELLGEATTGTDGSYEISLTVPENETSGLLAIEAEAEDFKTETDSVSFDDSLARDFALEAFETTTFTASGTVTRADTDNPIEGVTVTGSTAENDEQIFETSTSDDGRYKTTSEIRVVDEPNEISISAESENFDSTGTVVGFGSEIAADLALDPSEKDIVVNGTVKADLDEGVVEGAEISALRPNQEGTELANTTSVVRGEYKLTFTVLAPEAPDSLRLKAQDQRFTTTNLTVEFTTSITQDIELPPVPISTAEELQSIQTGSLPVDGSYIQTSDIDLSNYNSFEPIGNGNRLTDDEFFQGTFDGNGFAIRGLTIKSSVKDRAGLFGGIGERGVVRNVLVKNANVDGGSTRFNSGRQGILAGTNRGAIRNSETTGSINESSADFNSTGGLVGENRDEGVIEESKSKSNVKGTGNVGCLVGSNGTQIVIGGTIRNSECTGDVSGEFGVGGLVGENAGIVENSSANASIDAEGGVGGLVGRTALDSEIRNSEATGVVNADGGNNVGGLVGDNDPDALIERSKASVELEVSGASSKIGGLAGTNAGTIVKSFATGNLSANGNEALSVAGGLVGANTEGTVRSSYATGDVDEGNQVGGLIGVNESEGEIIESFAVGSVIEGTTAAGGLVGENSASISTSFWDMTESGQDQAVGNGDPEGSTGLTTSEMQGNSAEENMGGFDFQNTWRVVMGDYPALQWEE